MRLIYLITGNCTVEATGSKPDEVSVDLANKTWTHERLPKRTFKIGQTRNLTRESHEGIIGVFDADNFDHLKEMVAATSSHMRDTQRWFGGGGDDD
jgi:hypothetical protein